MNKLKLFVFVSSALNIILFSICAFLYSDDRQNASNILELSTRVSMLEIYNAENPVIDHTREGIILFEKVQDAKKIADEALDRTKDLEIKFSTQEH